MAEKFAISDTHFNHARILTFKSHNGDPVRHFASNEEMNETMIDNWNKTVGVNDSVSHLGDVFFGSENDGINIIRRLNGKKKLIVGNHDKITPALVEAFDEIVLWVKSKKTGMVFSHMPLHHSVLKGIKDGQKNVLNIHGHIHEKISPKPKDDVIWVNVSVEQINYTPISIDEIRKTYDR